MYDSVGTYCNNKGGSVRWQCTGAATRDSMKVKNQIMDEKSLNRAMIRLSHEIVERNKGAENLQLVGIRRRGATISEILASNIEQIEAVRVPQTSLDIRFYRDDLSRLEDQPILREECPLAREEVNDRDIVLADDVIYTGRTVRAAIEAIFRCGRPRTIQLAVIIDRGHRELPIRPDYVGKNVPTSKAEIIEVHVPEYDGDMGVYLLEKE